MEWFLNFEIWMNFFTKIKEKWSILAISNVISIDFKYNFWGIKSI